MAVLFLLGVARAWPALRGASAYAAASPSSWASLVATTIVVVIFLGAYARGWIGLAVDEVDAAGPYRSQGCLKLQKWAGSAAWGLLITHLAIVWVMTFRVGPVALSQYELWRSVLSLPAVLGFYVLGLAAMGLYLSQGLAASFRTWGFGVRPESSRWLELGCTLASAFAVLMAVNVLSHFATGRAYWGSSSPAASSAIRVTPPDGVSP
jgi:hypothetical protein